MKRDSIGSLGRGRTPNGILMVANFESDVGFAWWLMENFWVELSRLFDSRGGRSVLIYPKVNRLPPAIQKSSIRVCEHDFADHSMANLWKLRGIIRSNQLAHVYLTDQTGQRMLYALLRSWGIKSIVNHDHSYRPVAHVSKLRRVHNRLKQSLAPVSCDHYIAVSEYIRNRLILDAGVPPGRVSCVLNGIEPIEIDANNKYYAHNVFGFSRDAIIVVTTGRASESKGLASLIECARRICAVGPSNLFFLHCGDGPDLERFRMIVKRNGLDKRFLLAGRRSDVSQILASCHIGIQISKGEGFSLALLEYLSAGLATLAADVGGNPEAVRHGETGLLFPPDDLDCVIQQIQSLASNGNLRADLGAAASASVHERFNIGRTNRSFVQCYTDILDTCS